MAAELVALALVVAAGATALARSSRRRRQPSRYLEALAEVAGRTGLIFDRGRARASGELGSPVEVSVVHGLGGDLKIRQLIRVVVRIVPELCLGLRVISVTNAERWRSLRGVELIRLDGAPDHALEVEATYEDQARMLFDGELRALIERELGSGASLRVDDRSLQAWLRQPDTDRLERQLRGAAKLAHELGARGLRLPPPSLAHQVEPIWLEATRGHPRRFEARRVALSIETEPALIELLLEKRQREWWTVFDAKLRQSLGPSLSANRQTLGKFRRKLSPQAFAVAERLAGAAAELELSDSIRVRLRGVVGETESLRRVLDSLVELARLLSKAPAGGPYR